MGHMTLSLSEEKESALRALAKQKYGDSKGALSQTVEDLLSLEEREVHRRIAVQKLLALGEKGFLMGKLKIKHRSELYDRKVKFD